MKENMFYGASKLIFQKAEELRKNMTYAEEIMWGMLKGNQFEVKFRRQHPISFYIADFYCHELKLVIEIDGSIYNLEEMKINDATRESDLKELGIKVLRFTNNEVLYNAEIIKEKMQEIIRDLKSPFRGLGRILVFDNYDSFTYNLVHLVEKITGEKVDVYRNDKIALAEVAAYDKIILSPGPGIPEEAGLLLPLIKEYAPTKSILGVCLGHQAIAEAFGGKLTNLSTVFHGVATPVTRVSHPHRVAHPVLEGLPETFEAGRYHSWIVSDENFPEELEVTARDEHGYIMGLQHKRFDVQGVQFHPESVLTPDGGKILQNWLKS
jgi:anthranilate synthase component 2